MKKEKYEYRIVWTQTTSGKIADPDKEIVDETNMAEAKAVIDYIKSLGVK